MFLLLLLLLVVVGGGGAAAAVAVAFALAVAVAVAVAVAADVVTVVVKSTNIGPESNQTLHNNLPKFIQRSGPKALLKVSVRHLGPR